MSKRKILLLAMAVAMVAILAIGGTLAYFTDEDDATNTFTIGNVDIDLEENFEGDEANLQPGLDINKDVYVTNTGSNDAYVRVHIAIRSDMDDGDPTFAAVNNFLHFNFTNESVQPGYWSWTPEYNNEIGYRGNGAGNWNFYTQEIDDIDYNVYVVTYRTALKPGESTANYAMDKVYLDKSVDCDVVIVDGVKYYEYKDNKGNVVTLPVNEDGFANVDIKVWAEATQTATFTDAYDALNTAFGVPGTYNPWAE